VRNIRGKIKNVGAPTFLGGTHSPRFCVSRGNKRDTRLAFVCRGNKGDSPPSLKLRRVGPSVRVKLRRAGPSRKEEAWYDHVGVYPRFFAEECANSGKDAG
jgi:hypothetical protein